MRHKSLAVAGALAALALTGCAPQQALLKQTASGYPEETVEHATVDQVRGAIMEICTQHGALVQESAGNNVVCGKQMTGSDAFLATLAMGNSYSTTPERKLRFTIYQMGDKVRVTAQQWAQLQMAFGQVKTMELNSNNHRNDIQAMLTELANAARQAHVARTRQAPAVEPTSLTATQSQDAPIAKKAAVPTGEDAFMAGKFGRDAKCGALDTPAVLAAKGPGYETYSMACTSGDTLMIRCELGNCRALR